MKKNAIAIAVGMALLAGTSAASAESKVYAKAHVTLDSVNMDVASGSTELDSTVNVTSNRGSRLGYKFAHELESGMKAFGQIEYKADFSEDGTNGADRPSYVGLQGGFGKVALGHMDNPYKLLGREVELMGDTVADARSVTMIDNSAGELVYANKTGGFSFMAAFVPEDGDEEQGGFSANGIFENEGLLLGAAYESNGTGPADTDETESGMRLAGGYDFGGFRLVALWESITNAGGTDGADFTNIGLGGEIKSGNTTYAAQYYMAEGDEDDAGGSLIGVGIFHKLDKMITVYLAYAATTNDDATNAYKVSAEYDGDFDDANIEDGGGTNAISVGTIINF